MLTLLYIFQKSYKPIWLISNKQEAPDADSKVIQQINFIENLDGAENTVVFFINKKSKETILDFSQFIVFETFAGELLKLTMTNLFWFDVLLV